MGDPLGPDHRPWHRTPQRGQAVEHRLIAQDCRAFVRIHFDEVQEGCDPGYMYVTRKKLYKYHAAPLTHEQALQVPLRAAPLTTS